MQIHSGHYQKKAGTPIDIEIEYEAIGCGFDCVHYLGKSETVDENYNPEYGKYYKSKKISHGCSKQDSVSNHRESIYSSATIAFDSVPFTYGGSVSRACTQKTKVFEEIIDVFRKSKCPFYCGTSDQSASANPF